MDRTELQRMLNTLVNELQGVEAEFDALERRRESLRQAVSGLQGVLGVNAEQDDEDVPDPALRAVDPAPIRKPKPAPSSRRVKVKRRRDRPRGTRALWLVMEEAPLRKFNSTSLLAELESRGWTPVSDNPKGVVRTTVRRLMAQHPDEIIKVDEGVYMYRPLPTRISETGIRVSAGGN